DITIVGGGATTTIVDGNRIDRVFDVSPPGRSLGTLRLQDLTVQRGSSGTANGGGIRTSHAVYLLRVRLRDNSANLGGGLFGGNMFGTIAESTISDNAAQQGAGIYYYTGSSNPLTLVNTTISGNQATGT